MDFFRVIHPDGSDASLFAVVLELLMAVVFAITLGITVTVLPSAIEKGPKALSVSFQQWLQKRKNVSVDGSLASTSGQQRRNVRAKVAVEDDGEEAWEQHVSKDAALVSTAKAAKLASDPTIAAKEVPLTAAESSSSSESDAEERATTDDTKAKNIVPTAAVTSSEKKHLPVPPQSEPSSTSTKAAAVAGGALDLDAVFDELMDEENACDEAFIEALRGNSNTNNNPKKQTAAVNSSQAQLSPAPPPPPPPAGGRAVQGKDSAPVQQQKPSQIKQTTDDDEEARKQEKEMTKRMMRAFGGSKETKETAPLSSQTRVSSPQNERKKVKDEAAQNHAPSGTSSSVVTPTAATAQPPTAVEALSDKDLDDMLDEFHDQEQMLDDVVLESLLEPSAKKHR